MVSEYVCARRMGAGKTVIKIKHQGAFLKHLPCKSENQMLLWNANYALLRVTQRELLFARPLHDISSDPLLELLSMHKPKHKLQNRRQL